MPGYNTPEYRSGKSPNTTISVKQQFEQNYHIYHEGNSQLESTKPFSEAIIEASVNVENETYLMTMPCCVSVQCHPGVCCWCELPSCGVECVDAHVCEPLMSVRACPKVLGDSREQCLWFPDGLYCGGRWYVFLRKSPSRPFSPSYTTDPPPHPWDPPNYTNCINCTVKEDRTFPCSVQVFISATLSQFLFDWSL